MMTTVDLVEISENMKQHNSDRAAKIAAQWVQLTSNVLMEKAKRARHSTRREESYDEAMMRLFGYVPEDEPADAGGGECWQEVNLGRAGEVVRTAGLFTPIRTLHIAEQGRTILVPDESTQRRVVYEAGVRLTSLPYPPRGDWPLGSIFP